MGEDKALRESQIAHGFDILGEEIEKLDKIVGDLEARISSILNPTPKIIKQEKKEEPQLCVIAKILREHSNKIKRITSVLTEIRNRVEL